MDGKTDDREIQNQAVKGEGTDEKGDKEAKHWKHLNTVSALSAAAAPMHFLWTTRKD